jgi:hypothetical protein
MRRPLRPALLACLALAALLATAPARAEDAPGRGPAQGWPDWVPRTAATAAVYGALYVTAVGAVAVVSTGIAMVVPPAAMGTAMTLGVPAVMVVVMRQMVPAVVETVPQAVLGWFGIDPSAGPPPQPVPAPPALRVPAGQAVAAQSG